MLVLLHWYFAGHLWKVRAAALASITKRHYKFLFLQRNLKKNCETLNELYLPRAKTDKKS